MMRVYIDSNLGHHCAQGGEDLCDTCADWIVVCDEAADCYEGNPDWLRVGATAWKLFDLD
jgi:hypothetical protein